MADEKRNAFESLAFRLRASGTPESEIQTLVSRLTADEIRRGKHACAVCGRSSGNTHIQIEDAGEIAYSSPTRWVYCYRERDKPLGLCDQCFDLGRFDGFTPDEIAYFRESFEQTDQPDENA